MPSDCSGPSKNFGNQGRLIGEHYSLGYGHPESGSCFGNSISFDWLYPTHQFNSSHDKNTRSDIIHEYALFDDLKISETVSEHEAGCTRVLYAD